MIIQKQITKEEKKMGFCTQCGNQIPNTEKNCHYCGAVNEGYVPPKVEPKQAAQDYNA